MKRIISLSFILPIISGCFLYDCGYTRNDDTAIYKTDAANKMPISYSFKFESTQNAWGIPDKRSVRSKIEETLINTGLFSEVEYSDTTDKGYHVEFIYMGAGENNAATSCRLMFCMYTLFLIPVTTHESSDLSAVLYLNGVPLYSTAHTEKGRYVTCIYALPVGMVLNVWSVWRSIEYNIVRSTVNDLTKEHIRRYLDPTTVELTNPEDVGEK